MNLYRLVVPSMVIRDILRHSNVRTGEAFYVKPTSDDVRGATEKFENIVTENLHSTILDSVTKIEFRAPARIL